jgi:glycosyltransferase 2 family protein
MISWHTKVADMGKASRKLFIFGFKLAITCGCFWYLLRQVNVGELFHEAAHLDYRWFAAAVITMVVQIFLVALRWSWITNALEPQRPRVPLGAIIAISMIANFIVQIIPNVVGDAYRIWMLSKVRNGWRKGLVGVVIDRGVGIGALLAIGFVTLLNTSTFTAFAGFRQLLLLLFGALLFAAAGGLVCARLFTPILARYRATKWMSEFILASRDVLLESPAAISIIAVAFVVHFLSIAGIWELGKAFAMPFGGVQAAVLFTLMVAAAIVPVSVSGWGLREMMVTAFLTAHGMPAQRALLFSISFGLTLVLASTPGAIIMMLYSPGNARRTSSSTI